MMNCEKFLYLRMRLGLDGIANKHNVLTSQEGRRVGVKQVDGRLCNVRQVCKNWVLIGRKIGF